ncbi:MAG: TIGR03936 family radical SAM-associated protein [Eubacteriales bacterium]
MLSEGAVRIRFRKTGKIKYISHLDLCRTLKTAFVRAGIPIWYSEGFNPRPKMVFALTVSVGSESRYEILDIRITRPMEEREFKERLSSALTSDITVDSVYIPHTKLTDVAYSSYDVTLEEEMTEDFLESLLSGPMIVSKHSKKGDLDTDIRPMIREITLDGKVLHMILAAAQGNTLNPDYVMKAINAAGGNRYEDYSVMRTAILNADLTPFR